MSLHYNPIFRKVFVSVLPLIISWSLFFLFCCNSVSFISFRIVFSGKTGITGLYLGYMGFHIENYQKRQILGNKGIKNLIELAFTSILHYTEREILIFLAYYGLLLNFCQIYCKGLLNIFFIRIQYLYLQGDACIEYIFHYIEYIWIHF